MTFKDHFSYLSLTVDIVNVIITAYPMLNRNRATLALASRGLSTIAFLLVSFL